MVLELLHSIRADPARLVAVALTHRHRDASGGLRRLPTAVQRIYPRSARPTMVSGYHLVPIRVPHDRQTWGYLINGRVAYLSDYADIRPGLPALRKAEMAILDGSGWTRSFPSHQPMVQVIPVVARISRLRRIFFTHNGHTRLRHATLQREIRCLGDRRFAIAYHGLQVEV